MGSFRGVPSSIWSIILMYHGENGKPSCVVLVVAAATVVVGTMFIWYAHFFTLRQGHFVAWSITYLTNKLRLDTQVLHLLSRGYQNGRSAAYRLPRWGATEEKMSVSFIYWRLLELDFKFRKSYGVLKTLRRARLKYLAQAVKRSKYLTPAEMPFRQHSCLAPTSNVSSLHKPTPI